MIRNAGDADLPALRRVASETAMFLGDELESFMAMLGEALGAEDGAAKVIVAEDACGQVVGAATLAAETMAQGVMNLQFIGVAGDHRRQGHAAALLDAAEGLARAQAGRLMIIETAGTDQFAPARALYLGHGYAEEARVRDFYDAGLDKVIFRKAL